ncbi:MAG: hypothetical protein AB7O52_18405 [Planctomycetota bacterium]
MRTPRLMSTLAVAMSLLLFCAVPAPAQTFVRGNANGDAATNLADVVFTLAYLFQGGPVPVCQDSADVNDDGALNVSDPIYLLGFLFGQGQPPPPPFPGAGSDPTADSIPCDVVGPGVLTITLAHFQNEDNALDDLVEFEGHGQAGAVVVLRDQESGYVIAQRVVSGNGQWSFDWFNPLFIPCVVRAESLGDVATRTVQSAPSTCGPPEFAPTCTITPPPGPIALGVPVTFVGVAHDPEGTPLQVAWHFGGAVDSTALGQALSDVSFAETVVFDVGGQAFRVVLTVTDGAGLRGRAFVSVVVGQAPDLSGLPAVSEQPVPGDPTQQTHAVLAFNDLGMHCADLTSVPFSILPPFNTLNAIVVARGDPPQLLDDAAVQLVYSGAANPVDPVVGDALLEPPSINSTSSNLPVGAPADLSTIRKSDFWDPISPGPTVVAALFGGLNPPRDEGLPTIHNPGGVGRHMPGITGPYTLNEPQPFSQYRADTDWFTAEGIPMAAIDDFGRMNSFPLMRVQARESGTATVLAAIDAVVPVSTEVDCRDCHVRGEVGADPVARPAAGFVDAPSGASRVQIETAAKENILRLHDLRHGTQLLASAPILCASCHNSYALEEPTGGALTGDPLRSTLSSAMHAYHGLMTVNSATGELLRDGSGNALQPLVLGAGQARLIPVDPLDPAVTMEQNCFTCHPGKITQCFRGAMFAAGLECSHCHGDMLATGGVFAGDFDHNGQLRTRLPWRDEPRCESCHQGDAVSPGPASMLRRFAHEIADPAAVPLLAANPRFAENPGTIYRNSHGHAGVACEACHGSPHAIWPNPDPDANDNVLSRRLQGYAGPIRECTVCHLPNSFPNGTLGGPHGMHPINDPNWIRSSGGWHKTFAQNQSQGDSCAPCHGVDHRGTRLSVTPVDRELRGANGNLLAVVRAGQQISCDLCHSLSDSFDD